MAANVLPGTVLRSVRCGCDIHRPGNAGPRESPGIDPSGCLANRTDGAGRRFRQKRGPRLILPVAAVGWHGTAAGIGVLRYRLCRFVSPGVEGGLLAALPGRGCRGRVRLTAVFACIGIGGRKRCFPQCLANGFEDMLIGA